MLKILIVDDHLVVREGLKRILADNPDIEITDEASNGKEALTLVSKKKYDLILLDLSMPDRSGMAVLKDLRSQKPEIPVMILTMHTEEQYALRAFREGASGYITKEEAADELINAMYEVSSGGKYISRSLAEKIGSYIISVNEEPPHMSLSLRELEVMKMLVRGKTIKEISSQLKMRPSTVRTHKYRIKSKIGVNNDVELMRYAIDNGVFM